MGIRVLLLIFCLFPFTQIIPLPTYNQPYALLLGAAAIATGASTVGSLPDTDRRMLLLLATVGTIMFALLIAIKMPLMREVSFYLSYISPLLIIPGLYALMRSNIKLFRRILEGCILVWVAVGVIQLTIAPGFLTFLVTNNEELTTDLFASGRGAIGLAPEPTHNGFHLFIMGAVLYILGGNRFIAALSALASVLIAGSSSVVLAAFLGGLTWALLNPVKNIWIFVLAGLGGILAIAGLAIFDPESRLLRLLTLFIEDPEYLLYSDASVNSRISGAGLPLIEGYRSMFWPNGMTMESWLEVRTVLLQENRWVYGISKNGPASGFGLIILQAGIIGLAFVLYCAKRLVFDVRNYHEGTLFAACFITFLSQLYLSTPTFSLVMATLFYFQQYIAKPTSPAAGAPRVTSKRDQTSEPITAKV